MKTTDTKSPKNKPTPTPEPHTPPKPDADQAVSNPAAGEMEGGRKAAVDGRFEADHRPSR